MERLKKSFNISSELAERMDLYLQNNPGVSFTFLVNQAISCWLNSPTINIVHPKNPVTKNEINQFMDENQDLMEDLANGNSVSGTEDIRSRRAK